MCRAGLAVGWYSYIEDMVVPWWFIALCNQIGNPAKMGLIIPSIHGRLRRAPTRHLWERWTFRQGVFYTSNLNRF